MTYKGIILPILRKYFRILSIIALSFVVLFPATSYATSHESLLSDQNRKIINGMIENYIMKNPAVILESIQIMQDQEKLSKEKHAQTILSKRTKDLFDDKKSFVGGNPDGDITLVEFFDYQCGYCKRVHSTVRKLLEEDGNIRFIYKEFPILGPASTYAAKAAIASIEQGKYLELHNALMEVKGALSEERVLQIARTVGLDTEHLLSTIEEKSDFAVGVMELNYGLANDLVINGTPAFVVGNEIIRGAVDLATLKNVIKKERADKKTKGG